MPEEITIPDEFTSSLVKGYQEFGQMMYQKGRADHEAEAAEEKRYTEGMEDGIDKAEISFNFTIIPKLKSEAEVAGIVKVLQAIQEVWDTPDAAREYYAIRCTDWQSIIHSLNLPPEALKELGIEVKG